MGCFWEPDDFFSKEPGVLRTTVGYSGGTKESPTYEDLGDHTETTEIEFDPNQTSYEVLLKNFFKHHDPTQENSTQYRSVIFTHDDEQKRQAEATLAKAQAKTNKKILTTIEPARTFYKAEEYHQKYLQKKRQSMWFNEQALGVSYASSILI